MDAAKQNAIYDRLQGTDSIRLLELQPGREAEPLRCDLLHVESLSRAPQYACISYVWGDPTDTEEIGCRKSESPSNLVLAPSNRRDHGYIKIPITKSLAGALKVLRLPTTTRLLWADAICINQHDNQERNHQVGIMGRIYAECCSVHIWLGPSDEHTSRAVSFMGKISDFCQYHCLRKQILKAPNVPFEEHPLAPGGAERRLPRTSRLDYRVWDRVWEEHVKENDILDSLPQTNEIARDFFKRHVPETKDLFYFFTRPYFRRVWMIQEVARCRDITVHCGNLQLPWYIVTLSGTFGADQLLQMTTHVDDDAILGVLGLNNTFVLWQASRPPRAGRYETLLGLLEYTRTFQATDPRDKVYGLLGLPISSTDPTVVNEFFFGIEPDYRKTAPQVCFDVALGSLQYLNSLEILSFVSHRTSWKDWQVWVSWVPTWDPRRVSNRLDPADENFDAAGLRCREDHSFQYTILGTNLSVLGARHGSIRYMSRRLTLQLLKPQSEAHQNPLLDTMENSSTLVIDFNGSEPGKMKQDDSKTKQAVPFHEQVVAYARTLSADSTYELASPRNDQAAAGFAAYLCQIHKSAHSDHVPTLFAHIARLGLEGELLGLASTGSGENWFEEARVAFHNRRVFKTAEGRIGLGPDVLEPEDVLCVLQGGNLIYALRKRPHDTGWWFIGVCYVYGCMYGELMEGKSWSDDGFEWFELV